MKGIDVSAWQEGGVNWDGVKAEGMEFCIVKMGENLALTETFVDQINQATEKGLKTGVYYYSHAITPKEAQKEADWVAEQVLSYLGACPELGVWFDAEDGSMVEAGADVTALCNAFIDRMSELGINDVGIYSGWKWLSDESQEQQIHMDRISDNVPYWVAQYNSVCDLKNEQPNKIIRIWQFTDCYSDELPYDGNEYYVSV